MAQKVTLTHRRRIAKLAGMGWTIRQIAEDIGLSHGTVGRYMPKRGEPPDPDPPPPPPPAPPEEPDEPLSAEQLSAWVGEQVRRQRDEASRCAAVGDGVGQQRAAKLMAMFAAMARRMMPDEEDRDTVRVRVADMEAAAQQTREDLERILRAVVEEQEAGTDPLPFGEMSPAQGWIRRLYSLASSIG
jgi:hypothetical protein